MDWTGTILPDHGPLPVGGRIILPRGPLWNRAAFSRPEWARPWERAGLVALAPSTYGALLRDTVDPDANGLRIETLTFGSSTNFQPVAGNETGWRVFNDGSPYDETWGTLKMMTPQSLPVTVGCNLVFEAGAVIEIGLFNSVSALSAFALARGYVF